MAPDKDVQLDQLLSRLRQIRDSADWACGDVEELVKAAGLDPGTLGSIPISDNGQARHVNEEEARRLWDEGGFDVALDMRRHEIRFIKGDGRSRKSKSSQSHETCRLRFALCKVLYVGLQYPGEIFGDQSVHAVWSKGQALTSATLRRHIAEITKLLQGRGTRGPYLYGHSGADRKRESSSGYGYTFDEEYDYVVLGQREK